MPVSRLTWPTAADDPFSLRRRLLRTAHSSARHAGAAFAFAIGGAGRQRAREAVRLRLVTENQAAAAVGPSILLEGQGRDLAAEFIVHEPTGGHGGE